MAFTEAQVKYLEAKLDSKHVKTRQVQEAVLAYVEGWHVIAEANRIFGYDAWDRQTLRTQCVWSGMANRRHAVAYTAKVRIVVRAGSITITREGCGSSEAKAFAPGEAHELAIKAAETDATKRALATFGNPFGLALYDRELAGVRNRKALELATSSTRDPTTWTLRTDKGAAGPCFDKPEDFAQALKKTMAGVMDIERLFGLWEQNVDTVRAMNRSLKRECKGGDLAQSLVAHLKQCAVALAKDPGKPDPAPASQSSRRKPDSQPRCKIDKSKLTFGELKRHRSKEHLRYVGRQPCLICGRAPSHAHHIRYAQPKGVALKVSDEFTVPLCAIHHTENHTTGDERNWWNSHGVDPLPVARDLWSETHKVEPE
jgi:DNA recombination protein Rad52